LTWTVFVVPRRSLIDRAWGRSAVAVSSRSRLREVDRPVRVITVGGAGPGSGRRRDQIPVHAEVTLVSHVRSLQRARVKGVRAGLKDWAWVDR
jgi:hypothetical protein